MTIEAEHFLWEPDGDVVLVTLGFKRAYRAFVAKEKPKFEGN